MLRPYNTALVIPFLREPERLVKKETVNGISGNTQGVTSAINPPRNPRKKIEASPLSAVSSSPQGERAPLGSSDGIRMRVAAAFPPSSATVNSCAVPG